MPETLEQRRARLAALEAPRPPMAALEPVTCEMCGRDSYTGARCTVCVVRGALKGVGSVGTGGSQRPRPAEAPSGASVLIAPESVCPVLVYGSGEPSCGHNAPGPVGDLACDALLAGWSVQRGHSRGSVMGGQGKQLAPADIWTVRFQRPGWMGYAMRRGAAWDSVWIAGATLPPFGQLGVTDLRSWLTDPERPASWYAALRAKAAASALAAKKVKCPGAPGCVVDVHHEHRGDGQVKYPKPRAKRESGG